MSITKDQAKAMLPDGDTVHTFVNPGGILIGADWRRARAEAFIDQYEVGLSGEQATRMKHGLYVNDGSKLIFIETKEADNGRATD